MSKLRLVLKWVLPFVVSAGFLGFLLSRMDTGQVLEHVTPKVLGILVPAMLAFAAISLLIEVFCLVRLVPVSREVFGLMTAARVKSASYLLYILHYTLGAGALAVLLRRRADMTLSSAGGIVLLIALFDMSVLVVLSAISATFQTSDAAALRAGVITVAGFGIVAALERGADLVICPRVTDAAVVVGPAAWKFGWARDDWDQLAGAVVAGHIIECGAQCTGGNYSFFKEIPSMQRPGFPIAEMHPDGSFVITKHEGTDGEVSVGTVTAQLLYEIQSTRYANPDVVASMAFRFHINPRFAGTIAAICLALSFGVVHAQNSGKHITGDVFPYASVEGAAITGFRFTCTQQSETERWFCLSVIAAVLDTHEIMVRRNPKLATYCAAARVGPEQARRLFLSWAYKKGDNAFHSAAIGIVAALREAGAGPVAAAIHPR